MGVDCARSAFIQNHCYQSSKHKLKSDCSLLGCTLYILLGDYQHFGEHTASIFNIDQDKQKLMIVINTERNYPNHFCFVHFTFLTINLLLLNGVITVEQLIERTSTGLETRLEHSYHQLSLWSSTVSKK